MNKRLISLLLVIMMICMLLPMSALAADGVEEQDTGTIAVVVYGKALTNVLDQKTLDALKAGIISVVAAEEIPEITFSLEMDVIPVVAEF